MYMPSFRAFLRNMNISQEDFSNSARVEVPTSLLKFMFQILLTNASFNERGYTQLNPDVESSVRHGEITSGRIHYIGFGFFEGREGAAPEVDEEWYRRTYPDVDNGIKRGAVGSASEHFQVIGASEGRSPNPEVLQDALQWKKAFGR